MSVTSLRTFGVAWILVLLGTCGLGTAADAPEPDADALLPAGRFPTPAAVSLDQGKLTVRVRITDLAMPGPPGGAPIPLAKEFMHQSRYLLDGVTVYDTQGQKVDAKELPRLLQKPVVGFVYHDKEKADPKFMRLLKPGTLTFVLPEPVEIPRAPTLLGPVAPPLPLRPLREPGSP